MIFHILPLMVALAAVVWHCVRKPDAGPITFLVAALAGAGFIFLGIFMGLMIIFVVWAFSSGLVF